MSSHRMDETHAARVGGPVVTTPTVVLRSRPVLAAVLVTALAGAGQAYGKSDWLRVFSAKPGPPPADVSLLSAEDQVAGDSSLDQETTQRAELAQPERVELPAAPRGPIAEQQDDFVAPPVDEKKPPRSIEDPSGSMQRFYAALARTGAGRPQAVTRIAYHGDSLVASDYVTATLRRKLQSQFGDAGHGFVLVANAWPAYFHNDVFRFASPGWSVSRVVGPYAADGLYGYGGVSFKGPPGVRARFGTATKGERGRNVSVFRLAYLEQPHGGELVVNVDGKEVRVIDTSADAKRSAFADVEVADGEHMLEIVTRRSTVRAFGVALERKGPGVVLDAVGIQGARIRFLDKQDDAHWAQQLQWRSPDLLVFQFGANESGDGFAYSMEDYHRTMKDVLVQAMKAVPNASCLVTAAMDRARKVDDVMVTHPIIPHIVKEQEATAKEVGCAFWNTYEAMGGRGSMAKWVRRGLGQADLTHPSGVGAEILGNWIYRALIEGYEEYRKANTKPPD